MENDPLKLEIQAILRTYGPYPLHKTAELGHHNEMLCLLQHGYSANQTNYDCLTPLHSACIFNQVQCAEILINCGAKVDAANIDGGTPLCDACAVGSVACVELLMKHGAEVNPPLSMTTPLHEACLKGSLDCTSIIIRAGARLNVNDCNFGTPLHAASIMNHPHCVRKLLQAGASVNAVKIHQTALHEAASNDYFEVGQILLEYGANVYASNNQNKLPIDLVPHQSGPFYDMLLEFGAVPRSLKVYCRQTIRAHFGASRIKYLGNVGWPSRIVSYLLHL